MTEDYYDFKEWRRTLAQEWQMAEGMEKYAISRMLGAPPDWWDYDE